MSVLTVVAVGALDSCRQGASKTLPKQASAANPEVSVVKATRKSLQRRLTVSSELVPFQQIDLFAKESGFVRKLYVDYGSHVRNGQVLAVLEIPELQMQLAEDDAEITDTADQIARAQKEVDRAKAQRDVEHLEFTRLDSVARSQPGLVAQQEVDDRRGKDLAGEAEEEAAESVLQSALSQRQRAMAKRSHDQVISDYSKIVAPFDGVVTERYANLGTLMQSGISSSTQALPLVQLSEDDKFRLVIPVPESYVRYIHVGDPVEVHVPAMEQNIPGRVTRFSVDVKADTRTMHTEVDVPNPKRTLMPGVYAEAAVTLDSGRVLAVPLDAVNIDGDSRTAWVVGPGNKMELRNLTLGFETPDDAEVISGISEGESVAVGDRSSLKAGEVVSPKPAHMIRYRGDQP